MQTTHGSSQNLFSSTGYFSSFIYPKYLSNTEKWQKKNNQGYWYPHRIPRGGGVRADPPDIS